MAAASAALPAEVRLVRVGGEAAGHYHRLMITPGGWPQGWQVVELNPGGAICDVLGSKGRPADRNGLRRPSTAGFDGGSSPAQ